MKPFGLRANLLMLVAIWFGTTTSPVSAAAYTVNASSKSAAYKIAWHKYCRSDYCEGFSASITIKGDRGTAYINAKRRWVKFRVMSNNGQSWKISVRGQND